MAYGQTQAYLCKLVQHPRALMTTREEARTMAPPPKDFSLLSDHDLYLFNERSHYRIYEKLGAHLSNVDGEEGANFAVWAPAAREVSVIGDFNGWNSQANLLRPRGSSGIWEGFIPGIH